MTEWYLPGVAGIAVAGIRGVVPAVDVAVRHVLKHAVLPQEAVAGLVDGGAGRVVVEAVLAVVVVVVIDVRAGIGGPDPVGVLADRRPVHPRSHAVETQVGGALPPAVIEA